jgi:hypothetical protein
MLLYAAVCVLGFGGGGAMPAATLAGAWKFEGNGFRGPLVVRVDADGKVEGSIHGQPITGTFDAAMRRLVFKRLRNTQDREGVQVYHATLVRVPDTDPPRHRLEGTFQSIAGPYWGRADMRYTWKAER